MSLKSYVKDNWIPIVGAISFYLLIIWLLVGFQVNSLCIFLISFLAIPIFLFCFLYDYFRKKTFYENLFSNLERLDKKYFITELLDTPQFYDGKILSQVIYETSKDMNEHVKEFESRIRSFKEYIELWIHEIKIPLSKGLLLLHNQETNPKKLEEVLYKMEDYVEQVLYYARSENPEKDYYIRNSNLKQIVSKVAIKNQDSFIYRRIKLELINLDISVYTDAKWLEFILNQVIQNSIKYCDKEESTITIEAKRIKDDIFLTVTDNGMGIMKSELPCVFDKTFTGTNGRKIQASTGMGLFICKNLCDKLGHQIKIDSKIDEFTKVTIVFGSHNYYNVIKENEL